MVDVYIPTWNSEATLEKCLQGVFKAVPDAEVYVIDNFSLDGTKALARSCGTYIPLKANLGEARTFICNLASLKSEPFLMVDSDVVLHPHFLDKTKPLLTNGVGAVSGLKFAVDKKAQEYEKYAFGVYKLSFPVVNPFFMDVACTLFNPEAVKGFVCRRFSFEDKALGDYIKAKGYRNLLAYVPCVHIGFSNLKTFFAHYRWSGAGVRRYRVKSFFKVFASVVVMPAKFPCKLTTFKVRLQYVAGFLLSPLLYNFEREPFRRSQGEA